MPGPDTARPSRLTLWLGLAALVMATGLVFAVRSCQQQRGHSAADGDNAMLHVRIHAAGKPIERALVRAELHPGDSCEAETDTAGNATLEGCPTGKTTLRIEASGYVRLTLPYELAAGENQFERALVPGAELAGRVIDDRDAALSGVRVDITPIDPATGTESNEVWTLETSADGSFRCDTLPAGQVSIQASFPDHENVTLPAVDVPAIESVAITLQRMAAVGGRVLGSDQKPLAAASIRLAGSGIWPARVTLSDVRGDFRFGEIPPGVYEVSASRGELVSAPFDGVSVEAGEDVRIELSLGPGRVLRGDVREAASGRVLAGAQIRVAEDALSPGAQETQSGADGTFELRGLRWIEQRVHIELAGYVAIETLWAPADPPLRATLLRAGSIRGRVEDAQGYAVADAELEVVGQTATGSRVRLQNAAPLLAAGGDATRLLPNAAPALAALSLDNLGVTQGAIPPIPLLPGAASGPALGASPGFRSSVNGDFELTGIPGGTYRVVARRPGFVSGESASVKLEPGGSLRGVEVTLSRGGTVLGRVIDGSRQPVAEARVSLTAGNDPPRSTITDESGSFEFAAVLGRASLIVQVVGRPQTVVDVDVATDARQSVTITIDSSDATLAGRVFDTSGDPVAGARIKVEAGSERSRLGTSAVSKTDGTFEVTGLPPPPYSVRAEHADYASSVPIQVADAAHPIRLTLDAGEAFAGTVIDASSTDPIAGARVSLRRGAQLERAQTDREGRFEFQRVARGTYQITAEAGGHIAQTRTRAFEGLRSDATREEEFQLEPSGSLSGEVVDRLGAPVWNAEVATGEPPDWSRAARSDHAGHFVLRELTAGESVVSARKGDATGADTRARVHAGVDSPGVIVRLDRAVGEDEEERGASPEPNAKSEASARPSGARESTDPAAPLALARRGDQVVVERVAPGSPADRLGLRVGDVVAAINGEAVRSPAQARGMLGLAPGAGFLIDVRRDGERLRLRYQP